MRAIRPAPGNVIAGMPALARCGRQALCAIELTCPNAGMAKHDMPLPFEASDDGTHPAGAWQDQELAELLRIWPVLDLSERRALLGFIRHIVKSGSEGPPSNA